VTMGDPVMTFFKSFRMAGLLLAASALLAMVAPAAWAQTPAQLEQSIAQMTNTYRGQNGKEGLKLHPALVRAAEKYAQVLAQLEPSSGDLHSVDGTTTASRAQKEGYVGGVGENVQWNVGYADPATEAMNWWKNSPGHNANLLSVSYHEFGVGAAKSK